MDRWSGRDDDDGASKGPQGRVARLGIGAFIKKDSGEVSQPDGNVTTGSGKIEVVASKRQQKQAQAAAAMPPPPAKLTKQPAPQSSSFAAPAWARMPPAGFYLEVQKNGEPVQQIELTGACTLFGRSANADVMLDHASISRQHATVCYQLDGNKWLVTDQGSAHGTFVNGKQVLKGIPTQITVAAGTVLFGASTRLYILRCSKNARPASNVEVHEESQRPAKQAKLDGTQAAPATENAKGQFADVVKSEVQRASASASPGVSSAIKPQHPPARTKPEFQKFMSSHLKRPPDFRQGSCLYDALPPEKQTNAMTNLER